MPKYLAEVYGLNVENPNDLLALRVIARALAGGGN